MFTVSNNKISITRGDSAYFEVEIKQLIQEELSDYMLHEGDTVKAQVRTEPNVGDLLIDASLDNGKLYFDDGTIIWHIIPADTKNLDVGTYWYDVELDTADGDVFTFIKNTTFKVTDEVTKDE